MTEILIKAAQLILSLSILVILHEMGHFITAKIFKCRVEKFYLFFDPWFSLFKKKVGETEYGIGWLPLGGYVKISGMIDESMDKEAMKQPPKPWEFRSKPAWQRLIIMIAGVTVNILLAFFLFAMVLWVWGEKRLPMSSLKDGIWCVDSFATRLGFQNGDKIVSVNGKPVVYFEDILPDMVYASQVQVERHDSLKTINMPVNFIGQLVNNKSKMLFQPRFPIIVAEVPDSSAAKKAGLMKKDQVLAINGKPVQFLDELKESLKPYKGQEVTVTVLHNSRPEELHIQVSDTATLGFFSSVNLEDLSRLGYYRLETRKYGFLAAFPAGTKMAISRLNEYVKQFKLIFTPGTGAYKGLGGFGSIANVFAPVWDWQIFWTWTAFLSIILAFMNILPIPALDGGHVLFLLYEMITRRKPSEKFLEYAQITGMLILLGLILFVNGMDIWRWISGRFAH